MAYGWDASLPTKQNAFPLRCERRCPVPSIADSSTSIMFGIERWLSQAAAVGDARLRAPRLHRRLSRRPCSRPGSKQPSCDPGRWGTRVPAARRGVVPATAGHLKVAIEQNVFRPDRLQCRPARSDRLLRWNRSHPPVDAIGPASFPQRNAPRGLSPQSPVLARPRVCTSSRVSATSVTTPALWLGPLWAWLPPRLR